MTITTNYSLDMLSLLNGASTATKATTSSTNFSDIFNSYLQQVSATNVQDALATTDTTSSTGIASMLGANSTYAYYLNSLLSGSNTTATEAMQTYLAQSTSTSDAASITSLFSNDATQNASNTLANMLMASYEAKQLQTVSAAQSTYEQQLSELQQQTPSSAIESRIAKLNSNAATLQSYVQNTLMNKATHQSTSSLNGVFNSIAALQHDVLTKYKTAQQAADANNV